MGLEYESLHLPYLYDPVLEVNLPAPWSSHLGMSTGTTKRSSPARRNFVETAPGGLLRCGLQGLRHGQEPHRGSHPVHAEGTAGAARQERALAAHVNLAVSESG